MSTTTVRIPKDADKQTWKRLIVVLENAPIEAVKVGVTYKLATTDNPATLKELGRRGKDTTAYRPDILHYVRAARLTRRRSSRCSTAR